jgi:hypothetical protein
MQRQHDAPAEELFKSRVIESRCTFANAAVPADVPWATHCGCAITRSLATAVGVYEKSLTLRSPRIRASRWGRRER